MNKLEEILLRLYKFKGFLKDLDFCKEYDIKPNTLSTWKKRHKIPYELLEEISQNENISMDWLLLGKENMGLPNTINAVSGEFKPLPDTFSAVEESNMLSHYKENGKIKKKQQEQSLQHGHDIEINFYPEIYASAGYGATNDQIEPQTLTVSKFFISTLHIANIKNIDIIRIYGDSMEPDFHNGEYVIVERVDSIEEVNNGNTVIANISGDVYIKKIEKIPFQKGIILNSTNTTYEPIKVEPYNLEELNIVGIVRGSITPH